ncbi:hypothetical protein [Mycobacterium sp. MAA66]|uniref:hypothetical protein n=1 Tax=Mycobacterium sp. MAA66 TaxID=3156297 RepID=UPI0035173F99
MSTESAKGFQADPAALADLGQTYHRTGSDLSAQAAQFYAAAASLHPDALGPVGSILTSALVKAAGWQADQATELGSHLSGAGQTSAATATAFVDADARVQANLGVGL